ncbi:MAG: hypothetical protein COB65_13805 [Thalassobium sp.]|nr:MAG: hypothetical protein COB65_13805 [Thalassobium sp.]
MTTKKKLRVQKNSFNPKGITGKIELKDENYRKFYQNKFSLNDEEAIYNVLKTLDGLTKTPVLEIIKKWNKLDSNFW